jgi:hypothetical protein
MRARHGLLIAILALAIAVLLIVLLKRRPTTDAKATEPESVDTAETPSPAGSLLISQPPVEAFPEFEDEPEYRSKLRMNPSSNYGAYISPQEWEMVGNIYIKNMLTDEVRKLTHYKMNSSTTPKKLRWINDTLLLVIAGYTWGTITVGGNLYVVDSRNGMFYPVIETSPGQEVAEMRIHKNSIVLRIAHHNNDMTRYRLRTKVLPIDSLLASLRTK